MKKVTEFFYIICKVNFDKARGLIYRLSKLDI